MQCPGHRTVPRTVRRYTRAEGDEFRATRISNDYTTGGLREPRNRIISVCLSRTLNCFIFPCTYLSPPPHNTRFLILFYYVVTRSYTRSYLRSVCVCVYDTRILLFVITAVFCSDIIIIIITILQ